MDLIHPHSVPDVVETLREASARRRRLLVAGGRAHIDKGNPCEVDAELWTTMLDELVAYEPAEMVAVVGAGMRVGDLARALGEHGQEWPVDAPPQATVGGVIAAGASSPRRLSVGAVRDTVLEVELVTGDGRLVRSGARTVKNVTGYDVHKLVVGSLGTLGVIVRVALKVRPLPALRRTVRAPGGPEAARGALQAVPLPAGVLALPDEVEIRLEGWPERVKVMQRNWIGRSEGALIRFAIEGLDAELEVFTTRPDTIYGATFMVIAPEHPVLESMARLRPAVEGRGVLEMAAELSAENHRAMLVPPGCAHGFLTLEPDSLVLYFVSAAHDPARERGVRWNDPTFAIAWPFEPRVVSARDRAHPDFAPNFHLAA